MNNDTPAPRRFLVVHGPNLNMLGTREPAVYGHDTLDDVDRRLREWAEARGHDLRIVQSNHEGAIIDAIQAALGWADGIVINPGALTHYSYAVRDAVAAVGLPASEPFRHTSVVAPVCRGQIAGLGWYGYVLALEALARA